MCGAFPPGLSLQRRKSQILAGHKVEIQFLKPHPSQRVSPVHRSIPALSFPISVLVQDQNQKHFVKQCHTRFPNANNGVSVLCTACSSPPYLVNGQTIAPPANQGATCNGCIVQPYEEPVHPVGPLPC